MRPTPPRTILRAVSHRFLTRLCAVTVAAAASFTPHQPAHASQLIPYAAQPVSNPSTNYTVEVNGVPVTAEKLGDVAYVRFAFTGTANIEVTTPSAIASAPISPLGYGISGSISGSVLTFSISQPRTLIIPVTLTGGPEIEKLVILADAPEVDPPQLGDPDVTNFADYLSPTRNPNTAVSSELNTAINDVSTAGGGVLYLPNGLYMSTQVTVKPNVTLYLESGAMLRAVVGIQNTTAYPAQNNLSDSSFVYIGDPIGGVVDNVTIMGRGIIDGNGYAIRTANSTGNIKTVRTKNATNFVMEDVLIRDASRWTVHLLYSDYLSMKNVKIVNNLLSSTGAFTYPDVAGGPVPLVSNTDGIDLDSSTFVTVDGCFVYTGDDATSPKVTFYMGVQKECHDLVIKNCVLQGRGAAMRVGTEARKDMYNILFTNNEVVGAKYFIRLAHDQSPSIVTKMYNVHATNNRTEYIGNGGFFHHTTIPSVNGGNANANWYLGIICPATGPSSVNGLYAFDRAVKYSSYKGYSNTAYPDKAGLTSAPIANIAVKNMYVAGYAIDGFEAQTGTTNTKTPAVLNNIDSATVTLTAPGGTPTVEVAAIDAWSKEGATTGAAEDTGTFVISRMGSLASALTVNYTLSGTALNGTDYNTVSGSVTIPAGAYQAPVVVSPKGDANGSEGDETVTLTLSSGSYTVGGLAADTVTIANASVTLPTVTFTMLDGSANESGTNSGRFKIIRTGSTAAPLTTYFTLTGTATNGVDYTTITSPITIPAGAADVVVYVYPIADHVAEGTAGNEDVWMNGQANAAYIIGTPASSKVVIADTP